MKGLLIAISAMLLWALYPDNPYGYYVLLKWVVTPTFIYVALKTNELNITNLTIGFGFLAFLYNPIFPIYLGREVWTLVNLLTVGLIIYTLFSLKGKNLNKKPI